MMSKESNSDEFLIYELQKGSEGAFDYIFRKYYEGLCLKAKSYVFDMGMAQSLVQDCFVKLWVNRLEINKINNLSSYLSFMVRNRCIDHIRKMESLKKLHSNVIYEEAEANVESSILFNEFEQKLMHKITLLPKRSRLAFEYSRFDNLTYVEIGEKMDISIKAVEALITRALKILRKDLQVYLSIFLLFLFS
ncbi:RNA polymerase sigma-70 factor [Flavivirga aquimarina]|uniref:RNA polymerase sigma-70 factor n=1 Tax=Flavivirga aquimarina TaxID=2027862 RepID=A0ABT8WBY1_9FLAO|nr:RNA polymerase sigma-70 factor [Flavivirga aquimarina]MDO5970625.1 RNA polymerase sigma-70 factor [Flavivirga aquimarina]